MADSSDVYLVNGVPVPMLIVVILVATLTALFAGPIYRFDMNFTYGRVFMKTHESLADMAELRK